MATVVKPHPFTHAPHKTLLALMFPVLLSLIAEPLTGLVDTAFVAQLGTDALAGLGVATVALSTLFWVFNFLNVGTQTQVSRAEGAGDLAAARQIMSLALIVGWGLSAIVMLLLYPLAGVIAELLGASGDVKTAAVVYTRVRLFGTPAIFTTLIAFGALRGVQDMRTPSIIAVAVNVFNIALDYPLMFGFAGLPGLGVAGAALASTISQWLGAVWIMWVTVRRFGFQFNVKWGDVGALFSIGGNLFLRSGLLTLYLLIATRAANQISPEAGAAHQVIRQVYIFTALALDAFAVSTQSLVGHFIGAKNIGQARRAAIVSIWWSLGTGVLLAVIMLLLTQPTIALMVPAEAAAIFIPAWIVSALAQPVNALAFSTDGIHMGAADYGYLRNAMMAATVAGTAGLWLISPEMAGAFTWVWVATAVWVVVRAAFGVARVYVQRGNAPLAT